MNSQIYQSQDNNPRLGGSLRWALLALMGIIVSIMAMGLWASPANAQTTHFIGAGQPHTTPCDLLVLPAEDVAEGLGDNVLGVEEGDTIKLLDDGDGTPLVYECIPAFELVDPGECELTAGNGIGIEADNVTFDLNGHSIHSTFDVAFAGEQPPFECDVENAGVSVGGTGVTVTNTSNVVSLVDNFTANFDLKTRGDAKGSKIMGLNLGTPEAPVYNLVGGDAHGGGALAIDKSHNFTIDTVKLVDETGDNGIDLKKCTGTKEEGPSIVIKNSIIKGRFTGIRIRGCEDVALTSNDISSGEGGIGVELLKVKNSSDDFGSGISGNTIHDNAFIGIGAKASENVSINGNIFTNNGFAAPGEGCDIEIDATSKNIKVGLHTASDGSSFGPETFNEEAACLGGL